MPKLISPVVTTYNRERHCSRAIESILARARRTAKILAACLLPLTASLLPSVAASQTITPDGTTPTNVRANGDRINIRGGRVSGDGTNLFHSFEEFGVQAGQTAVFYSDPSILNILSRVTGGNPSAIDGRIRVTGGNSNLFLMNPAGIVFGSNATLNVPADFTATTATGIGFGSNNWFNAAGTNDYSALVGMPSTFTFGTSGTPGAIVNAGRLGVPEGQNLTLLGGTVVGTGQLRAPGGVINIAAVPGQNLVRISQPDHLLNLEIQPCGGAITCAPTPDSPLPNPLSLPALLTGAATQVTGLTTNGGQVVLASGLTVPDAAGTVVLSGTANASTKTPSQMGGSVQLLGNLVGLVEQARVNVSGESGGGTVAIASNSRGQGTLPNASRIFIGSDVNINANARQTGNGGTVSINSDETTRFYGNINARGGATSGNGGFVSVTAGNNLTFDGTVDTSATNENKGTLLLGSANFTISDAVGVPIAQNSQVLLFDNPIGSNTISWGEINKLSGENNVVLQAAGSIAIADVVGSTPDVTQNNLVNLGFNTGSLTLRSTNGSIAFQDTNDAIQTQGGAIAFEGFNGIAAGSFLTNGGAVSFQTDNNDITVGSIDSRSFSNGRGGNVDIDTARFFRASGINGENASISTGGGSILIQHGGGSLGIPFTVGPTYNGPNGTAGAISTGTGNQIRSRSFLRSYNQGTPPSNIQIITPGTDTVAVDNRLPEAEPPPQLQSDRTLPSLEIDTVFAQLDESFTRQFAKYFGKTFNNSTVSLAQANDVLRQVEKETGTKPALIYAVFVPATINSQVASTVAELRSDDASQASRQTEQLELVLVTAQGKAIRKPVEGATRQQVLKIAQDFRSGVTNIRNSRGYLRSAQQLYKWLVAPLEVDLQTQKINNLVFLMDTGLRTIPVAALHDGKGFLVERYSVALMPSLNLTDTRYRDIKNAEVLAMGAETFPDQKPLPAVPVELSTIAGQLWKGKSFLNDAFTLENLKVQRQRSPFGIVHLATHAEFLPGTPENSYIQLSNGKLRLNQLPQLGWNNPPVDLLVLSACRTAVGDEQIELGFAGLAVQAGVKSAVASLWSVSDEATLGLMTQFYEQLKIAPTKAEALRRAQLAMLKGQVRLESGKLRSDLGDMPLPSALAELPDKQLTHPYYWAAFTMVGNPW